MKRYTLQSSDSTPAALLKILTGLQSLILPLLRFFFFFFLRFKHSYSSESETEHKGKVKEVEKPPLEFTDVSTSVSIHLFQQQTAAESFTGRRQAAHGGRISARRTHN